MSNFASASTTPQQPSLITDSAEVSKRLHDVHARLLRLADDLHDQEPREVENDATPDPTPSVRRNLDNARHHLGKIEDALAHIDARL